MEREFERDVQGAGMTPVLPPDLGPEPLLEVREEPVGSDAAPGVPVVVGEVDLGAVGRLDDPTSDDGPTPHRRRTLVLRAQRRNSLLVAVLLLGLVACAEPTDTTATLDQRTCEIARDIAGDFNVTDTFDRTQERLADLYNGYGESTSASIHAALLDWTSGMTSGDLTQAAQGVTALSSACSTEGY